MDKIDSESVESSNCDSLRMENSPSDDIEMTTESGPRVEKFVGLWKLHQSYLKVVSRAGSICFRFLANCRIWVPFLLSRTLCEPLCVGNSILLVTYPETGEPKKKLCLCLILKPLGRVILRKGVIRSLQPVKD